MNIPDCKTLILEHKDHCLFVTLNRPKVKNAMSLEMVNELMATFEAVADEVSIRALVIRGAEGSFCAGGDIKDMAGAAANARTNTDGDDPFFTLNRAFGRMITFANALPQTVITVTEGAVLGGGFGLACISDIGLSLSSAKFGLPETGLGIPPAQIAPFVVKRIGLTQTRKIALLGARFNGEEAQRLGIVHDVFDTEEDLESGLQDVLEKVKRCAPQANRITKALVLQTQEQELESLLDYAATQFAACVQGDEGREGTTAFMQKRLPAWAE